MRYTHLVRSFASKIPGSRKLISFLIKFLPSSLKTNFMGMNLYINPRDVRNFIDVFFPLKHPNHWHNALSLVISEGDRIIDVGGNIGLTAIISAKSAKETGEVIVFEPEPDCYRLLKKNIKLHEMTNIHAYDIALSDKDGSLNFFIDKDYSTLNSLSEKNILNKSKKIVVQTIKYDSFMEEQMMVHLLKMNIQGGERLVIEGAGQMIKQYLPMVISEFWPEGLRNMDSDPAEFIKYFIDLGYEIYSIDLKGTVSSISESTIQQKLNRREDDSRTLFLLFQHKKGSKYIKEFL